MSRGPAWALADKQLLARIYPTATKADLISAFPQRSWCGIRRMAQDLFIKRDPNAASETRSEAGADAARRKKGAALGPRQVVIQRQAPARDAVLVAHALQQRHALEACWNPAPCGLQQSEHASPRRMLALGSGHASVRKGTEFGSEHSVQGRAG